MRVVVRLAANGVITAAGAVLLTLLASCGATPSAESMPTAPEPDASQRAQWEDTRPADYSFVLESRCGERSLIGRFAVTVRGGKVTRAVGLDQSARAMLRSSGPADVPTIDALLVELDDARAADADRSDVVFDATDGVLASIDIDYNVDAVDDEACYRISDYIG